MPVREDLLRPIPGPSTSGPSLRYDSLYEKIKEARREEEDVDQGDWKRPRKVADWPLVIKLASEALATKSKDLQIAAWLTEALLRQEGLGGLHAGLGVLQGLLERFWDTVHPELEDGNAELRAKPLNWMGGYLDVAVKSVPVTKTGHHLYKYAESRAIPTEAASANDEKKQAIRQAAIEAGKLTPEEFDRSVDATPKAWYKQLSADLGACGTAVQDLDEVGRQRFGDDAPNLTKLQEAIEEVREIVARLLDKKLQTDPEPVDATPQDTPSGRIGESKPVTLSVEPTSVEDAGARIASAARYLRQTDPQNPAPYLLLRGFRWGELRAGGVLDLKMLSAPPTHLRTYLKGLLLDRKWAQLLDDGENVMGSAHGRGWLDLQRYELTACEKLGAGYDAVAKSIRGALVVLLRDVPQLPDVTLMDDTPTANTETRAWLQQGGLLAAAAQAAEEERFAKHEPMAAAGAQPRASWTGTFERALEEVRSGRPQKGIELLLREAEQEKSARARFLRRSEAASIMVDSGLESVALPILRELVEQIEAHKLDDWEVGNLVARPMGLLYRCLLKLGGDADMKEDLYRRICRLDPLQAIAFPAPATDDGVSKG